jgi:hypothetical protein
LAALLTSSVLPLVFLSSSAFSFSFSPLLTFSSFSIFVSFDLESLLAFDLGAGYLTRRMQ